MRQVQITAGALVLTGVVLGLFVAPGFFGLSAFVGAGLMFAGVTGLVRDGEPAAHHAVEPARGGLRQPWTLPPSLRRSPRAG